MCETSSWRLNYNSLTSTSACGVTIAPRVCDDMWFVNISWLMLSLECEMAKKVVEVVLFIFSWAYSKWVLTVTGGC